MRKWMIAAVVAAGSVLAAPAHAWGETEQKLLIFGAGVLLGQHQQQRQYTPPPVIVQQAPPVYFHQQTHPGVLIGNIRVAPHQAFTVEHTVIYGAHNYYPATTSSLGTYCAPGHLLVIKQQHNGWFTTVGCR